MAVEQRSEIERKLTEAAQRAGRVAQEIASRSAIEALGEPQQAATPAQGPLTRPSILPERQR